MLEELDEDTVALLLDTSNPESSERRPKHFKGKGRAWKKEESDEDEEFTLAKKKAAKAAKAAKTAKAKLKGQLAEQKKRGRPRKSVLSEDIIHDESDSDAAAKADDTSRNVSPLPNKPQAAPKRVKAKPRKSALSEEIVRDDSDSETTEKPDNNVIVDIVGREVVTPSPKKQGRPRKSDQSTTSISPISNNVEVKSPQNKSCTPQGTPNLGSPKETSKQSTPSSPLAYGIETKEDDDAHIESEPGLSGDLILTKSLTNESIGGDGEKELGKYSVGIMCLSSHAYQS